MSVEGKALYEQGDYSASEKILREVVAFRERAITYRNASARRQTAHFSAAHAMALAALGRHAEARTVLQPVIELWRAEQRSGSERVRVNYDLANALMVQAMASGGLARAAALAEASSLLARLPGELQQMRDVRDCRERIARLSAAGVQQ
jgi:tetratricopeptide (TPR) repeat protein